MMNMDPETELKILELEARLKELEASTTYTREEAIELVGVKGLPLH